MGTRSFTGFSLSAGRLLILWLHQCQWTSQVFFMMFERVTKPKAFNQCLDHFYYILNIWTSLGLLTFEEVGIHFCQFGRWLTTNTNSSNTRLILRQCEGNYNLLASWELGVVRLRHHAFCTQRSWQRIQSWIPEIYCFCVLYSYQQAEVRNVFSFFGGHYFCGTSSFTVWILVMSALGFKIQKGNYHICIVIWIKSDLMVMLLSLQNR